MIVFTCLLRWQRQYLVVLKSLNGSWIQTWWSARNHAMHAHLSSHDIIDFRGKQCRVISPTCTILFGNCANVPFILSSSKCQFYRRWTSGICLTWLVNVLAGADRQCNGMSQEEYFINRCKLCDSDLFICLFHWHTHLKDMNSPWWIICFGRYKQL